VGLFLCKNVQLKKMAATHPFRPQYFGHYPKIQNSALYFFKPWSWGFLKGMSHPCSTKTQGGDRFSRNRLFSAQGHNPWGRLGVTPAQKILVRSWTGPENFIKILSFHQNLFNFFLKDRHPYTGGQIFFMPVFDTFHFNTFALLTPFMKDNDLISFDLFYTNRYHLI